MAPAAPILPKSTQDLDESKYLRPGVVGSSASSSMGAFLKGRRARTILYAAILFLGSLWLITHFGHSNWKVKSTGTDDHEQAVGNHHSQNDAAAVAAVEGDLTEALDVGLTINKDDKELDNTEDTTMPVEAEIRSLLQRYPVLVFSKSYCP
jgi:cytoskeletal protein RodZ